MLPNVKNYYRPTEIAEAVKLLASDSARNVVLGGGTQLALSAAPGIDGLVDLRDLGLDYIRTEKNAIVLGARCRPTDAIRNEGLRLAADGIVAKAAANYLAEVQRNRASLGGILVSAAAWADIATSLLAVGGEVVIVGALDEKALPIDQFFATGPAKAAQRAIIKELRIPSGGFGAYLRVAKTETDISIVDVAVRLDLVGESVSQARIAVGGVGALPVRLEAVEKNLIDNRLTADLVETATRELSVAAVSDFRASGEYRNEVTQVLVKRCLLDIAGRTK